MRRIRITHHGPCWPATSFIAMMTNRKLRSGHEHVKLQTTTRRRNINTVKAQAPDINTPSRQGQPREPLRSEPYSSSSSSLRRESRRQRWREPTLAPDSWDTPRACVLRADGGPHPTAPYPHGPDAPVRSKRRNAWARPPPLTEQPRGAEQSARSWQHHQRRELRPAQ